jgi:hypothetical protein
MVNMYKHRKSAKITRKILSIFIVCMMVVSYAPIMAIGDADYNLIYDPTNNVSLENYYREPYYGESNGEPTFPGGEYNGEETYPNGETDEEVEEEINLVIASDNQVAIAFEPGAGSFADYPTPPFPVRQANIGYPLGDVLDIPIPIPPTSYRFRIWERVGEFVPPLWIEPNYQAVGGGSFDLTFPIRGTATGPISFAGISFTTNEDVTLYICYYDNCYYNCTTVIQCGYTVLRRVGTPHRVRFRIDETALPEPLLRISGHWPGGGGQGFGVIFTIERDGHQTSFWMRTDGWVPPPGWDPVPMRYYFPLSRIVQEEMTLSALFEPTNTVTFDANSGTFPESELPLPVVRTVGQGQTFAYDLPQVTMPQNPSRVGYVFAGWYQGTPIAPGGVPTGYVFTATTIVAMDKVVYARWTARTDIEVTFNANHGVTPDTETQYVTFGGTYYAAMTNTDVVALQTRAGFVFGGWFDSQENANGTDQTGRVIHATVVTNAENHTLWARWTARTDIQVTFNANHGLTPATVTQYVTFGETYADTLIHPDVLALQNRIGFTFAGWWTTPVTGGEQVFADTEVTDADDHTLWARWTPLPPNGGGGGNGNGGGGLPPTGGGDDDDDDDEYIYEEPDIPLVPFTEDHIWYVRGFPDGGFNPENSITRAEISMILWRLIVSDEKDSPQVGRFNDIHFASWYAQAVNYLASHEILQGYEDGTFRPNAPITRAELTAVMSRFFEINGNGVNNFSDVDSSHWAVAYISNALNRGWVEGFPDGTFRPNNSTTRAEAVTLLNRVLGRIPNSATIDYHLENYLYDLTGVERLFTDVTNTHWAFYHIMEAAIEHEFNMDEGVEIWTEISIPWWTEIS